MILHGTMHIMAIRAGHLFFANRVMGEEVVRCFYIWMTAIAELGHLFMFDFLLRSLMKFMTIEATDVIERVSA